MRSGTSTPPAAEVCRPRAGHFLLLWGVFPVGGAALGAGLAWGATAAARWLLTLPWSPFDQPASLLVTLPVGPAVAVMAGVGVLAGLVLALLGQDELIRVTVDDRGLKVARGDNRREVARDEVGAVFLDGKAVVVLGHGTEQLVRFTGEPPAAGRLGDALRRRGYPWLPDGDPHAAAFRRWVKGHPDLPAAADAYLVARERALKHGDAKDADELRAELTAIGVAVREEGRRQYWRRSDTA
ncbi:YqeB family protein [Nocardiopsis trehalosi]|jgi:hypothetical protein|uniref:YqeB family protein n=1 Tax=Nocardiopsis trehalosi TaxID=109329 RepID=UPI0008357F13|nr:hypothetical protein [Nocardiopsis trehalosi]